MWCFTLLVSGHPAKCKCVSTPPQPATINTVMPIDSQGKRHQCTIDEKIKDIKLHAEGNSYREIEKKTIVSRTQAQKISNFNTTGSIDTPQCPGALNKLDERDKRYIIHLAKQASDTTVTEITADSQLNVCSKTVWAPSLSKKNHFLSTFTFRYQA